MDNITDEQKDIVDELRRRTLENATPKMLEDEAVFYRFAKARDFNLTEAEAMLRKHISWRKEMKVDTILTDYEPPEVLLKYVPSSFVCLDKQGAAVRILDCGRTDAKGLWNVTDKKSLGKLIAFRSEQDKDLVIKRGGNNGKPIFYTIYDWDELTYRNAVNMKTIQNVADYLKMFLNNYPESLSTLTFINAPSHFAWIYEGIKPILPATVIHKVRIYGTDGWKDVLLKDIDADKLPKYLGGNRTDPDGNPRCETLILRGQPIPTSYYFKNRSQKLAMAADVKNFAVMPFSKEEITFEVTEENSYLEWEFETKNRDISFSLLFSSGLSKDIEPVKLIPKQRIDTCHEPEKGCFKYTIIFDNSYSWFHSKEVYYRIGIKSSKNVEMYRPA